MSQISPSMPPQGAKTKAKRWDRQNPVFARAQLGVTANHSSAVPSTEAEFDHAQADDDLQDIAPPQDPNISGMTITEDCYTWLAGSMDGWDENDDYRTYFEQSVGCDGMLSCDSNDGDFDDNGGYPTAVGHSRGDHMSDGSFGLGPVIIRRI